MKVGGELSWIQASKGSKKDRQIFCITQEQVEEYKAKGFEVRHLDPSTTGYWAFGDKQQANELYWDADAYGWRNGKYYRFPNKREDVDRFPKV